MDLLDQKCSCDISNRCKIEDIQRLISHDSERRILSILTVIDIRSSRHGTGSPKKSSWPHHMRKPRWTKAGVSACRFWPVPKHATPHEEAKTRCFWSHVRSKFYYLNRFSFEGPNSTANHQLPNPFHSRTRCRACTNPCTISVVPSDVVAPMPNWILASPALDLSSLISWICWSTPLRSHSWLVFCKVQPSACQHTVSTM